MSTLNSVDFAIRVCESIAFSLHAMIALSHPFTGALTVAFGDKGTQGGMPNWFWPTAGVLLLLVAVTNFSDNNGMVIAAQLYIASFHAGAVFYHIILEHHPAAGSAPAVFIVMAFIVMCLRTSMVVAAVAISGCILIAKGLSKALVYPPANSKYTELQQSSSH